MMADLVGLGGQSVEEKVQNLIAAVERLFDELSLPRSIAALNISTEDFEGALPDLVKTAFADPSWLSNPRMPLVSELEQLFRAAYRGRGQMAASAAQRSA